METKLLQMPSIVSEGSTNIQEGCVYPYIQGWKTAIGLYRYMIYRLDDYEYLCIHRNHDLQLPSSARGIVDPLMTETGRDSIAHFSMYHGHKKLVTWRGQRHYQCNHQHLLNFRLTHPAYVHTT